MITSSNYIHINLQVKFVQPHVSPAGYTMCMSPTFPTYMTDTSLTGRSKEYNCGMLDMTSRPS